MKLNNRAAPSYPTYDLAYNMQAEQPAKANPRRTVVYCVLMFVLATVLTVDVLLLAKALA